jgi:DnaJ-class molecular chaperone
MRLFSKIFYLTIIFHFVLNNEDFYSTLGIGRFSSQEEIRKAYLKLTKIYHPDRNTRDSENARRMFIKISNAYEILSDPKKRRIYDLNGYYSEKYSRDNYYNFEEILKNFNSQDFNDIITRILKNIFINISNHLIKCIKESDFEFFPLIYFVKKILVNYVF